MKTLTTLTRQDLEKLQSEHPDYRMELVDGNIIIMSRLSNSKQHSVYILGFSVK